MKSFYKLLFTTILVQLCIAQSADAKVWRVNNKSNYNAPAFVWGDNFGGTADYPVFKQINQAVALANTGDTIHVEGSPDIYEEATITKKLFITGAGFFLTDNPKTSSNAWSTKITRIIFSTGSSGSQAVALNVVNNGNNADGIVYLNVSSITVKRCRIERCVRFETLLTDVVIVQNFFPDTINTNCIATNGNNAFVPPSDIIFNNNICQKTLLWGTPLTNPTTRWSILQCKNNVFDGPDNLATPSLAFSTNEFSNNILMATAAVVNISASPGVIRNNTGTLPAQFGSNDNNSAMAAINTLFVTSASADGRYQIAAASPAANSGTDGTDRGAFGGTAVINRYTLSGLSPIPVIYDISSSGVADATGITVTIKARTIK